VARLAMVARVRAASLRATAQLALVWQWPGSTMSRRSKSASCGSWARATLAAWSNARRSPGGACLWSPGRVIASVRWTSSMGRPDEGLGRLGVSERRAVGEARAHGRRGERSHARQRQQHRVVAPGLLPVATGRLGGTVDGGVSGPQVGAELGGLPGQGVEVEVPVPEPDPVSGRRADLLGWSRNVGDAAAVRGHHPGDRGHPGRASASRWGQRSRTPSAVGRDPAKACHTSGNAQRAWDTTRRRHRLASRIVWPRRCAARRSPSSIVVGLPAGAQPQEPARVSALRRRSDPTCPCRPTPAATGPRGGCPPATAQHRRCAARDRQPQPRHRRRLCDRHRARPRHQPLGQPPHPRQRRRHHDVTDHDPGPAGPGPAHHHVMVRHHRRIDPGAATRSGRAANRSDTSPQSVRARRGIARRRGDRGETRNAPRWTENRGTAGGPEQVGAGGPSAGGCYLNNFPARRPVTPPLTYLATRPRSRAFMSLLARSNRQRARPMRRPGFLRASRARPASVGRVTGRLSDRQAGGVLRAGCTARSGAPPQQV
jgi:hypothetical protein